MDCSYMISDKTGVSLIDVPTINLPLDTLKSLNFVIVNTKTANYIPRLAACHSTKSLKIKNALLNEIFNNWREKVLCRR